MLSKTKFKNKTTTYANQNLNAIKNKIQKQDIDIYYNTQK